MECRGVKGGGTPPEAVANTLTRACWGWGRGATPVMPSNFSTHASRVTGRNRRRGN